MNRRDQLLNVIGIIEDYLNSFEFWVTRDEDLTLLLKADKCFESFPRQEQAIFKKFGINVTVEGTLLRLDTTQENLKSNLSKMVSYRGGFNWGRVKTLPEPRRNDARVFRNASQWGGWVGP